MKAFHYFLVLLSAAACQTSGTGDQPFALGRPTGTNKNKKLAEASGLVASFRNPGMLWTLNDSGHPAHLFLLDTLANTIKTFKLAGVHNRDWEDIAAGFSPDSIAFLFVGDIGDNNAKHKLKYIYRLKEPALEDDETITTVDTLVVKMEDGPRDTECLMFDPVSKNLYLISKRESEVGLYEIRITTVHDTLTAHKVLTLPLKEIVAGDISPDGSEVLVKSYLRIYYWKKKGDESIVQLLATDPIGLPYDAEPVGESIAWARDGSGYYTLSENTKGEKAELFFYRRK